MVGRAAPGLARHHGLNGLLQTLLQRGHRGEFQHFARLSRVTHRHPQVTGTLRRIPCGKTGALHLPNYLAELADLGLYTGADVIDLRSKGGGVDGQAQRVYRIPHIHKVANLVSVAVDLERRSSQYALTKNRNDTRIRGM